MHDDPKYAIHDDIPADTTSTSNGYLHPPLHDQWNGGTPLYEQVDPPRRHYRKRICAIISALVILAIIIAVALLFPRNVDYSLLPLQIDNKTINIDPSGFTFDLQPVLAFENHNHFDIGLHNLQVTGNHPLYADGLVPLGIGHLNDAKIPKRRNVNVTFPFNVHYNRTFDPLFTYFGSLLSNCTDPGNRKLFVSVDFSIAYSTFIKSGIIHHSQAVEVPCPIDTTTASTLLAMLSSVR